MPAGLFQTAARCARPLSPSEPSPAMTYPEVLPHYLAPHADRRTRALHYAGTLAAAASLGVAAVERDWRWLSVALVVGYGPAWLGHIVFERNRPATFGHPLWSLWSDVRMLALFLTGRLPGELRRRQ